jgi:GT2 family glycosyltransferase
MAAPTLSVVVLAYRERELLAECLAACVQAAAQVLGEVEVLVVDNGDLAQFVAESCPQARVIEPGVNLGFAGGVQRGIEAARSPWIALVNDDARLEVGALNALLTAGDAHPDAGSIAAQIRFAAQPARINSAGIVVDALGSASERWAGRPVEVAAQSGPVFGASACVGLYRAAMLDQIGGFDERFFAYLEDVDVAWRAQAAGWTAWYEAAAIAYHHGSASSGARSSQKYFLVGRNRVRLLARNATRRQLLRALPAIGVYDTAYVGYVALADRTLAPLRGRIAGLRDWRSYRRDAAAGRREVALAPAARGVLDAWRMQRAYRDSAPS